MRFSLSTSASQAALATVVWPGMTVAIGALLCGAVLLGWVLLVFAWGGAEGKLGFIENI